MHRWSGHTVESGNVCRRELLAPENNVLSDQLQLSVVKPFLLSVGLSEASEDNYSEGFVA